MQHIGTLSNNNSKRLSFCHLPISNKDNVCFCVCLTLPAKCVSPSRLVGMLLWVLWVFLRWRVCNATMAGSCLLRHTKTVRAVQNKLIFLFSNQVTSDLT